MRLEELVARASSQRLGTILLRDELISWFLIQAEPQCRKGMAYTSPGATAEEIQRVLRARALAFFEGVASPFEAPTFADLRRVKRRMVSYLLPEKGRAQRLHRESGLWDLLLIEGRILPEAC